MNIAEVALSQIGVKEVVGSKDNPEVLKYFSYIGHSWVKHDETAWCSAFINWCAKKAGLEYSGKLNARSWLSVGEEVDNPIVGDIVVFWRDKPSSWKGHVGVFCRETKNWVYVIGGNQNNSVSVKAFPKSRVLSYRKLN